MDGRYWAVCDRWMRGLHLYTSLFLVPWMVVYACSAFCLNHRAWFATETTWTTERDIPFPSPGRTLSNEELGQRIAEAAKLDGPIRTIGWRGDQFVVMRPSATGAYRAIWLRSQSRLIVEKVRPWTMASVLNSLHFQHGYWHESSTRTVWAIIVDLVSASVLLWIVSGVYLWARRPSKRKLGSVCLVGGGVLFAVLVASLCR